MGAQKGEERAREARGEDTKINGEARSARGVYRRPAKGSKICQNGSKILFLQDYHVIHDILHLPLNEKKLCCLANHVSPGLQFPFPPPSPEPAVRFFLLWKPVCRRKGCGGRLRKYEVQKMLTRNFSEIMFCAEIR